MLLMILAQSEQSQATTKALLWLGVIMVIVIIGGVALLMLRNKLRAAAENPPEHTPGFSLSDLRAMRDRGEITPEEYETTRARIIAKVKGSVGDASETEALRQRVRDRKKDEAQRAREAYLASDGKSENPTPSKSDKDKDADKDSDTDSGGGGDSSD